MANWVGTLKLADIFHDDSMSFEDRRDEIVRRIRAEWWFNEDDYELVEVVESLAACPNIREFDGGAWDAFYDWADANLIWVETF